MFRELLVVFLFYSLLASVYLRRSLQAGFICSTLFPILLGVLLIELSGLVKSLHGFIERILGNLAEALNKLTQWVFCLRLRHVVSLG